VRSDRLLKTLSDYARFLVVCHDNPDPDAIATGWAVHRLIHEKLGRPVRLVGGGAIMRAENRHMVDLLGPPIELVDRVEADPQTAAVLVDCVVGTSNHLLTRAGIEPVAVIDHHTRPIKRRRRLKFEDVRPNGVASATIAASYLREQNIEPGGKLATALVYGIRTETVAAEVRYSCLDRTILTWLTARAEPSLLARIENAPLAPAYFGDLVLALQNTMIHGDTALCLLPRASGPEIVGEVADLLIRCQGLRRVLCGAFVGGDLLLSVRTERSFDNAVQLIQTVLSGLGGGGGHAHRAGGKIPGTGEGPKVAQQIEHEIRSRWLAACGVADTTARRLIPPREIVQNL
jgi:nanoRNase/pAp phosphatase (c-di-AMP/oligoRNAs hydrolase)